MNASVVHPDRFVYVAGFVAPEQARSLEHFLDAVPVVDPEAHDPTRRFTFTTPVAEGVQVRGRRESAAGWPVWSGAAPARGVELPAPLASLAVAAGRALAALEDPALGDPGVELVFSSVYVDRYPRAGAFVAHTDRDCYGRVVAGVSVGPGTCKLIFRSEGDIVAEAVLEPGSLYAFAGSLRDAPCTHEVADVSDLRFGITFRTPARLLAGDAP